MRKFLLLFEERNTLFPLQRSVPIVGNREDSLFAMKESSTNGSVMSQRKKSYQYILQINPIQYIIKTIGGVISGILWITEGSLILGEGFSSSLERCCGRCQLSHYIRKIVKILNIQIMPQTIKIVILPAHLLENVKTVLTATFWWIVKIVLTVLICNILRIVINALILFDRIIYTILITHFTQTILIIFLIVLVVPIVFDV